MALAAYLRKAQPSLAALAAGSMLLAGCGSSAPTKAQYTSRANSICATTKSAATPLVTKLVSAAGSLSSGQTAARELTSALEQLHNIMTRGLTKLRGLSQPTDGHAAIQGFLTPLATVSDTLGTAAKAAAGGEPQKALAALAAVAPDAQRISHAAAEYGLTSCQSLFGPLGSTGALQPVHATMVADNHTPTVNRPWHYSVSVTGPNGEKLSGTETTHFTYNGIVVGTEKPTNVKFTGGVYHDTLLFPASAVGHPLAVQAVIHTSLGSATVSWPIQVKR